MNFNKVINAEGLSLEKSNDFSLIEKMYNEYFPVAEIKSIPLLVSLLQDKKASLLLLKRAENISAFAFCYDGKEYGLIDYLAVCKAERGSGIGGVLLGLLKKYYQDKKGVALEIEALGKGENKTDNAYREKRKSFYLRNGIIDANINVFLNEVEMEVLFMPINAKNIDEKSYLNIYYETFEKEFADGYVRLVGSNERQR